MSANEALALAGVRRTLEDIAHLPVTEEQPEGDQVDALLRLGSERFAVEVKGNARSATVAQAVAQLSQFRSHQDKSMNLLLVVPSMGDVGADICSREHVNWIDFAGNASIQTNQLRIYIRGKHDKGEESPLSSDSGVNPFGRKASRIAHALLTDPHRSWTRTKLEEETSLDKGYVSKIVAELIKQRYLENMPGSGKRPVLRVADPMVLLDAWREKYKPQPPAIWGLVAARNGVETTERLARLFTTNKVDYSISGLSAAAHYTGFGSYRRVDAYVASPLPDSVMMELHTSSDDRGRNVAIIYEPINTKLGVHINGMRFASAPLTYVDLASLPERSNEAAEELRLYLEQKWK